MSSAMLTGGPGKVLYFDMPQYIKGPQLKSYGGMLTYTILYRGQGRQTSRAPHVLLSVSIEKRILPVFIIHCFYQ